MGDPMTNDQLQASARQHLWMHFTRMGAYDEKREIPVIDRGEGAYVYDTHGKRYLDGLSGLFVVQVGHGLSLIHISRPPPPSSSASTAKRPRRPCARCV